MFKNHHPRLRSIAAAQGISIQNRRLARLVDTRLNRWTGLPHAHHRERARRQRQASRT